MSATAIAEIEALRKYVTVIDDELSAETDIADALYSLVIRMDPDNGYTVDEEEYETILMVYEARRDE